MAKSNPNDMRKTIVMTYQSAEMTSQILRDIFRKFLRDSNANLSGKTTVAKLSEQSGGRLDEVKISDRNIGDFLDTARKYDVSYSLKCNKETQPPTWFVFFGSNAKSKDSIEKAFREFTEQKEKTEPVLEPENIKNIDTQHKRITSKEHDSKRENQEKDTPDLWADFGE